MSSPADAAADPYADPCALTAVRRTAVRAHAVLPAAAGVQPWLSIPASGGMSQGVLADDPLPPHPNCPFRADRGTLQHTLVRLPAVRSPWMRTILKKLAQGGSASLF
ncbi:hypothetical protein [Streptomyces sp. NPDC088358]|uniref:hypothetical protein n=2 Tax=Streptomyces TaxID=1883 RepID=UPI003808FEE7